MASFVYTLLSTAQLTRGVHLQPHLQSNLFSGQIIRELEKEKKQLECKAVRLGQKLEKQRVKATESLKTFRQKTVSVTKFEAVGDGLRTIRKEKQQLETRVRKLRNLKLQAEAAVEKKEATRAELLNELRQRIQYSTSLEEQLDRQQRYMDRCMMNLNKVGRVPTVRCIDCDTPTPLSDYQLRTSKIKGKSEHWLINPFCSKCRKGRQSRYEAQRRDKAKLIASGGTPTSKQEEEQVTAMATAFVERLPDGAVDRVLENLEIAEEAENGD